MEEVTTEIHYGHLGDGEYAGPQFRMNGRDVTDQVYKLATDDLRLGDDWGIAMNQLAMILNQVRFFEFATEQDTDAARSQA